MRKAGVWGLGVVVAATSCALLLGFGIKNRCTKHEWDGFQYRSSCYNDIYALYPFRGLDRGFAPYVDGDGDLDTPDGDLEYPVVTGYFIGAMARAADGGIQFFHLNALGLAAAGIAAAVALALIAPDRRRVLFFALGPSLILYAFHNWDLLAVAAMCIGLWLFARGRDAVTGAMLGLGAAAKLFPGFLIPGLALVRWKQGKTRQARALVIAGVVSFVVLNLPVLVQSPRGWYLAYRFNTERFPNYETSWYMLYRHLGRISPSFWSDTFPRAAALVSLALFAAGLAWLLRAESRRAHMRPWALSFGILLVFLLTGKVYSPQYALWVLPFFALLRLPWPAFVAFTATDAAVWFAISGYFLAAGPPHTGDPSFRLTLVEIAVWVRYGVLGWLLWWTRAHARDEDAVVQTT